MQLGAVRAGKVHVGQDIGLAVVDKCAELGPLASVLVGDVPQRLAGGRAIRLEERLAERG